MKKSKCVNKASEQSLLGQEGPLRDTHNHLLYIFTRSYSTRSNGVQYSQCQTRGRKIKFRASYYTRKVVAQYTPRLERKLLFGSVGRSL